MFISLLCFLICLYATPLEYRPGPTLRVPFGCVYTVNYTMKLFPRIVKP